MALSEKVALVTGASRGISRSVALKLVQEGAHIAIDYNQNREAAEQTLTVLPDGPHHIFQADIADATAVEEMLAAVIDQMGGLHIVVNNAAINEWQPPLRVEYEVWNDVWRRRLDTNLVGPANVMFWAARHMAENGGGQIVKLSSRGAFRGTPKAPAYAASKAARNYQNLINGCLVNHIKQKSVLDAQCHSERSEESDPSERSFATGSG